MMEDNKKREMEQGRRERELSTEEMLDHVKLFLKNNIEFAPKIYQLLLTLDDFSLATEYMDMINGMVMLSDDQAEIFSRVFLLGVAVGRGVV